MNKKGVFNIVVDLLIILIVLYVIIAVVYLGFWKKTEDITKSKLPPTEKLKALIEKFTTSPGEAQIQKQEEQTDKIRVDIQKLINQMKDIDCIEGLDFSDISDKDFTLQFIERNGKSKLNVYKIIGGQQGYFSTRDFNTIIYYFSEQLGTSFTAGGSPTPLGKFSNFKISDELRSIKIDDEETKEEISLFLYKDKDGNVGFFSKRFYDINFKYKQICSDGTYLETVDQTRLKSYKKVWILESKHTQDKSGLDNYRKYLGYWYKEEDGWYYDRGEIIWRELMIKPLPFNDKDMADLINWGMQDKFKIGIE